MVSNRCLRQSLLIKVQALDKDSNASDLSFRFIFFLKLWSNLSTAWKSQEILLRVWRRQTMKTFFSYVRFAHWNLYHAVALFQLIIRFCLARYCVWACSAGKSSLCKQPRQLTRAYDSQAATELSSVELFEFIGNQKRFSHWNEQTN